MYHECPSNESTPAMLWPCAAEISQSMSVYTHLKQRCWMCRYARVFVFCYTLALHLLIMGVLARWSHGHSQTLAASELLQAQQVCTCSAFATVCGPNRVICLTAVLAATGGVESDPSSMHCCTTYCFGHTFCRCVGQHKFCNVQ